MLTKHEHGYKIWVWQHADTVNFDKLGHEYAWI